MMPPEPNPRETSLFELLRAHDITHETHEHAPIFTVEDGQAIKTSMRGGHTKNLFLKDKAGAFVLICALGTTTIRLNRLHAALGTKRLSFANQEALWAKLGVRPGSVTLFSLINDTDHNVRLILDKALFEYDRVWFHPLRNTASTAITPQDMARFAAATGHTPTLIDFKAAAEK